MKRGSSKKILSYALTICIVIGMLHTTAFAEEYDNVFVYEKENNR